MAGWALVLRRVEGWEAARHTPQLSSALLSSPQLSSALLSSPQLSSAPRFLDAALFLSVKRAAGDTLSRGRGTLTWPSGETEALPPPFLFSPHPFLLTPFARVKPFCVGRAMSVVGHF